MSTTDPSSPPRPFAAPCRSLTTSAPLQWLRLGWCDYRNSLRLSLLYGGALVALSLGVSALAWLLGRYVLVLAMLSGFVFIAPLLATGLYSISRQVQRGEPASLRRALQRMRLALGNAMTFAILLMVVFLVWARAASMVHVFFPVGAETDWFTLLRFFAIGSAVGSIFATVSFAVSAFSLPMIVDRDVDMITACVISVNAVLRNKRAMLVWISLIVLLTALGFATLGLGLALVIPWLGYASYHGYIAAIDSSDWPLNDVTSDITE